MGDIPNILVTAIFAIGLGMSFVGWVLLALYAGRIDTLALIRTGKWVWGEPKNSKLSDIGLSLAFAGIALAGLIALVTLAIYPDGLRTP